jgi:hypothetical protein
MSTGMSATTTSPRPSKATRKVPRWRRALPWVAGVVLIAGVIVAMAVFLGNTANPSPEKFSNEPVVDVTKPEKTIKVPTEVRTIAQTFIKTAVARKNLDTAYDIVGPSIKQGMTRAEWNTGNIAVIPFPIDKLDYAPFKVDYAHAGDILMEVALLAKDGSGVKSQIFFINVKKFGEGAKARWLVDNWVPRGSAPVPDGTFRGSG